MQNYHYIEGGSCFANKVVEDILKWATLAHEPMFIIKTIWSTLNVNDVYRTMGIQWKTDHWLISSVPIRSGSLMDSYKQVWTVNENDPERISYTIATDEAVLELLRSVFDLNLWSAGDSPNVYFECEPELYSVYHTGHLKRVFCNPTIVLQSLDDWEDLVSRYLKIIKLLSKKDSSSE